MWRLGSTCCRGGRQPEQGRKGWEVVKEGVLEEETWP